jgi:hypothetical protein
MSLRKRFSAPSLASGFRTVLLTVALYVKGCLGITCSLDLLRLARTFALLQCDFQVHRYLASFAIISVRDYVVCDEELIDGVLF